MFVSAIFFSANSQLCNYITGLLSFEMLTCIILFIFLKTYGWP